MQSICQQEKHFWNIAEILGNSLCTYCKILILAVFLLCLIPYIVKILCCNHSQHHIYMFNILLSSLFQLVTVKHHTVRSQTWQCKYIQDSWAHLMSGERRLLYVNSNQQHSCGVFPLKWEVRILELPVRNLKWNGPWSLIFWTVVLFVRQLNLSITKMCWKGTTGHTITNQMAARGIWRTWYPDISLSWCFLYTCVSFDQTKIWLCHGKGTQYFTYVTVVPVCLCLSVFVLFYVVCVCMCAHCVSS